MAYDRPGLIALGGAMYLLGKGGSRIMEYITERDDSEKIGKLEKAVESCETG